MTVTHGKKRCMEIVSGRFDGRLSLLMMLIGHDEDSPSVAPPSRAFRQLLGTLALPALELPRFQLQLEHAINIRNTAALHLWNQVPRDSSAHQAGGGVGEACLASEVALVGVEDVG